MAVADDQDIVPTSHWLFYIMRTFGSIRLPGSDGEFLPTWHETIKHQIMIHDEIMIIGGRAPHNGEKYGALGKEANR
jgi:hypothetical protein